MNKLEAKVRVGWDARGAEAGVRSLREGMRSISDTMAESRRQLVLLAGSLVGLQGVRSLAQLADGFAGMTARLRVATRGQEEFSAALAAARGLAASYNQPLAETAALYTRLLSAVRPLGGGLAEASVATGALLASLKISGASAAESGSAILQFSQALGAGALRGEEFNAIAEAAPRLLDALAAGLGKPRHELKALAEQGQLTTDAVVGALRRELPKLEREAARIPQTLGGAAQGLKDAFASFVGGSAEATGVATTLAASMKTLAENIGTVTTALAVLASALLALKLGAFAQALYAAGTAAAAGAVGITAFGLALRGALAFITGPVGWLVALGSLAAGWLAVESAVNRTRLATRAAVEQELIAARQAAALAREERNPGTRAVLRGAADRRVAELETRLARFDEEDRQDAGEAFRRGERAAPAAKLRDPGTLTRLADEYKLAREISRKFENDRKALVAATETEVAHLREQGRDQEADAFAAATAERLKLIDKAEREALRKQAPTASRVAAFKASFDATLELERDAIEREKVLNQQRFDDGLTDLRAYLAERGRLEDAAAELDLAKLGAELAARRKALAANERRAAAAGLDPNERESAAEAVFAQTQEVARLEADIARRKRDQADATAARLRDERLLTAELERQLERLRVDTERQLAEAQGRSLTPEQLRASAIEQLRPQFELLARAGASDQPLLQLVDVQVTRAQLQQVQRDFERVRGALATREAELAAEVAAGTTTTADAEARLFALRAQQLPLLDAILERMRALAQTEEERAAIDALRVQTAGLRDFRGELERTARSAAVGSIATALNDITTGSKTAKDALLDMVRSFAQAMLNVLNQRLAEQLVNQFANAAGSSGAGGAGFFATVASWVASLFHVGGVAGAGGGVRRAVNPALFALAPRYHGGGIAGLMSGEVPAILKRGEEVLTEDDPRHARNFRGAGNVVNVSVSGAQGSPARLDAAGADLGRLVLGVIEQWAAKQSRTGGALARA